MSSIETLVEGMEASGQIGSLDRRDFLRAITAGGIT